MYVSLMVFLNGRATQMAPLILRPHVQPYTTACCQVAPQNANGLHASQRKMADEFGAAPWKCTDSPATTKGPQEASRPDNLASKSPRTLHKKPACPSAHTPTSVKTLGRCSPHHAANATSWATQTAGRSAERRQVQHVAQRQPEQVGPPEMRRTNAYPAPKMKKGEQLRHLQ